MNKHIRGFNLAAQKYSTNRCPGRGQCMRKVLNFLDPQIDDVILDVGCGPGTQLIDLAPLIKHGYGIDPADQMIRRAKHASIDCLNISFYAGSFEHLPPEISRAGVNKVFSNYALHHLSGGAKCYAIQTLASFLPASGVIILGDLMFSDDPDKYRALFDIVGYDPSSDTPSRLSSVEAMFVAAGLSPTTHVLNPLVAVIKGKKVSHHTLHANASETLS